MGRERYRTFGHLVRMAILSLGENFGSGLERISVSARAQGYPLPKEEISRRNFPWKRANLHRNRLLSPFG
jgi:hypothetical protein